MNSVTEVSSAYLTIEQELLLHLRSLVYSAKSKGDKTQPWGAPVLDPILFERYCITLTLCNLFDKKSLIHNEIDRFITVLELNHSFLFGDATYAINKNRQVKLRKPDELPLDEDMQKLRAYAVEEISGILNDEFTVGDAHTFKKLRDLTISRLTLFNARRGAVVNLVS